MFEPGKIMRCGGQDPAVPTTWVIDLNGANPNDPAAWLIAGEMNEARRNHNLVMLPDGKVLAVGGNVNGNSYHPIENPNPSPVFRAEIFDPASGAWTGQPSSDSTQLRMYDSTAMLLRDGRVVSAGANEYPTAQIFKPPYITAGVPRPTITSAPAYMEYGVEYTISYLPGISTVACNKACLIRLAAVTHGFDQNQRYVPLTIGHPQNPDPPVHYLRVHAPANGNIAPPGYYMLFILYEYAKNQFAPCELAAYVQVGP